MDIAGYRIDLDPAIDLIKGNQYELVGLQVPEGLKRQAQEIADQIEKDTDADILLVADPCYGACDVVSSDMMDFGVEFIIQIGHAPLPCGVEGGVTTLFVNAMSLRPIAPVIKKALELLPKKGSIGLVTTAQHMDRLDEACQILNDAGLEPIIGTGDDRISAPGQILGCNFSSARNIIEEVDCFLFIGSGKFHALGLMLATGLPVIAADPYSGEILTDQLEEAKDILLRQRYGAIATAKTAHRFAIIIGEKNGQCRMELARDCKTLLQMMGRKARLVMMDEFDPIYLEGFGNFDCMVCTACPRIALDDYIRYKIPMVTPIELEVALGLREWEGYIFDEITSTDDADTEEDL